jgi:hypothetical protein
MASKQIHTFATKKDLVESLGRIEAEREFTYYSCGLLDSPEVLKFNSLLDWQHLGIHKTKDHVTGDRFLVLNHRIALKIREVPQRKGGVKYAVDQLFNPSSIIFAPGGFYQHDYLITGHIGTASDDSDSIELYKFFCKRFTKGYSKVKAWNVGPGALKLLGNGLRFITGSVSQNPIYDLSPEKEQIAV